MFPEPRDVVYLTVRIAGNLLHHSGEHWIMLTCGGVLLLERRLDVRGPLGEFG